MRCYYFQQLTDWQRPWTVYVGAVNSYWFAVNCWQERHKYRCPGLGVISAGFICEESINASFSQCRHYLKSRFGGHRSSGIPHLGTQLTSGGMPLNGIAQSDEQAVKPRALHIESDGIYGKLFQRIFVSNVYVDISIGFTFKVSGACILWEKVSRSCNICVLSGKLDAASASGGFHPEGATINSSWNDVKWHVTLNFQT